MFSSADKTIKSAPSVQQKTAGTTFFRKAGEESFFGAKENPSFFKPSVQAKLTVSTPDDPQEKEADEVADKVMRMPEPIAEAPHPGKNEEKLQRKEEEEEVQAKQESPLVDKIQCKEKPGHKLQAKMATCNCGAKEDAHIHTKPDTSIKTANTGDPISLYPSDVMRQSGRGPPTTSIPFEQTLASSKGEGSALPGDTQQFMESRFNADFSGVRVHTDATAVQLSRNVNAQAFAHGNDIYFNSGKFSPGSTEGGTLLAHELTHTIQQGASKNTFHPAHVNARASSGNGIQPKKDFQQSTTSNTYATTDAHQTKNFPLFRKEGNTRKDPDAVKDKSYLTATGTKSNDIKNPGSQPEVTEPATNKDKKGGGSQKGRKATAISPAKNASREKIKPGNSKLKAASLKPGKQNKGSLKEKPRQLKSKASGKQGKKGKKKTPAKPDSKPMIRKPPPSIAEGLPSLAELFGPLPQKKKAGNLPAGPHIMRQAQGPTLPDPATVQAGPAVINTAAFSAQIMAASSQQQQSVGQQAETTKVQLTGSADSLKQSIVSSIEATTAAVRDAFNTEKLSFNTALDSTAARIATALETHQADALQSGEATKGKLTETFTQNRTEIQLLTEQKSQEVTTSKNEAVEKARNGTAAQAASARSSGQQKAGTYPGDERGREQANAATGVADELAGEIEKRQPDIIDALNGAMEDVPAAFQEQGTSFTDGLTQNLQSLTTAIDEQVTSTGGALTDQSGKAGVELEKLRQESLSNLTGAEQSAVEQVQANVPQVASDVAEALSSSTQEVDSAAAEVIQQLQKLERESVAALPGASDEKAAQDFTTQVELALAGIGNAAGSGFQQAGAGLSGSFAGVEASTISSLDAATAQVTQGLQGFHDKSSSGMSDFADAVDKGLEQQVAAQTSAFTETETTAATKLTEGKDALATSLNSRVVEINQQLNTTVTQGLSKNDEALNQLDAKMGKAAEDAAWDYDHPILSGLASIGKFIAGALLALVAVLLIALVVFLAFELLVAVLVGIGLSAEVAAAIVIIAGIGLLAYGVYTDYQARVQRGEGGGWGTFGMALLDSTGLTDMYNAFDTKGLTPFERGLKFGEGLGKFVMTILLVRGAWKGIRGGGLARAWKSLRSPKIEPAVVAPPVVAPPEVVPPKIAHPEVTPPEVKPPEVVPPEVKPADPFDSRNLGLREPATESLKTLENLKQDPVGEVNSQDNHNHYSAARREARGEIVAVKQDGRPFSHIGDLQQGCDGLYNVRNALEAEIRNPPDTITGRGIDVLDAKLREVNILINRLNGFLSSIGHGSWPPYHAWRPGPTPGTWIP